MNRLVIPEMDAELESLRGDLRKLLKLHLDMNQVVEALSAAVLQIRDKLELPVAPKAAPPTEVALRKALRYLSNEAGGMLGLSGVREAIGNTNMACLQLRVDEARELLRAERDGGK